MFTSDDRDDFEGDDSVLGHKPFSSEHRQHQVHHNHHQLSLFDLPSPYPFPCFSNDFGYPDRAGLNLDLDLDLDLNLFHQQLQMQQQPKPQYQQQQREATLNFIHGEGESKIRATVSADPGMRSSKKDRHSKITTARGPRDRRMRLSLEVAREFFDLQDMLGFDKASKTVEWLITQSASAIKEIIRKVKGSGWGAGGGIAASYTSDCEIGYNHSSDDDGRDRTVESSAYLKLLNKGRQPRQPRRSYCHRQLSLATRESRQKARERARKRTLEKTWMRTPESSRLNLRKPCSSSLQTGESSCVQTGTTGSNMEILTEYEEITARHISVDVSSDLVCGKWSPAMASSSNLNLQEIGVPRFNQQRDCEQVLMHWEAYYNYGYI